MAHDFITDGSKPSEVLSAIPPFSGRRIFIKYAPNWGLYILADEPITPEKARRWWNEDMSTGAEDYAHEPPLLRTLEE